MDNVINHRILSFDPGKQKHISIKRRQIYLIILAMNYLYENTKTSAKTETHVQNCKENID